MAAQVVQSPLANPPDSDEEEVAPPATMKPKKKTQFAAATTTTTTNATDPFSDEDEEDDQVLQPHSSGTNPSDHDDQGPVPPNMPKTTLRPCKSMAVNYNAAKGSKPESKLTKHMSLSSSDYTPFGTATPPAAAAAATTTASSGEAPPRFPPVSKSKSTFGTSDFWHLFGHKDTSRNHGTRGKEVMGAEDAGKESARKTSSDVFEHDDADSDECHECRGKKVTSRGLFGSEAGKRGRDVVGGEDGVVNSTNNCEVFGSREGGDGATNRKASEVFGDYDGEEEDDYGYTTEFVNKAVADLEGLTLTQATTTTVVTKTVKVTEAK